MDKVNRLRWIPMIVKAYSDARLRQELMKRGVDLGSTFSGADSRQSAADTRSVPASPLSRKPIPVKHLANQRGKLAVPKLGKRNANPGQRATPNIASVLKELREARKQMTQLENLQTKLTEMQAQMDIRMNQLLQRLNHSTADEKKEANTQVQNNQLL